MTIEKEEQVEEKQPEGEVLPQTKTFTQEEMDVLVAQARDEEKEVYKGIQRTVSAKDEEIKRLRESGKPQSDNSGLGQVMLDEMKASQEFGTVNPRVAQLESLLSTEKTKQARAEATQRGDEITREYRTKLNKKIGDIGLDPSDERFDDVWDTFEIAYAVDGKFERAEKKLDRILTKVKPEEKTKETTEDEVKRLAKEMSDTFLKEGGYLSLNEDGPSATTKKFEEVRDKYIENPDDRSNTAEYLRMRVERGI